LFYLYLNFKKEKIKSYIVEFTGTLILVLVIGLTSNPIAIGSIITVLVYTGIHISGAHYNPAVSIAMILRGLLSPKEAIIYIFSQLSGALVASLIVFWIDGALMIIDSNSSVFQILSIEFFFTFILIIVILYVATDKRTEGNFYYGIAIGFTIMLASFAEGLYNPAVGAGPILIDTVMGNGNTLPNLWYYLVGPISGAILATYVYKLIMDE